MQVQEKFMAAKIAQTIPEVAICKPDNSCKSVLLTKYYMATLDRNLRAVKIDKYAIYAAEAAKIEKMLNWTVRI